MKSGNCGEQNVASHQLEYEILGASAQSVEIILDPGETVIAEAGAMNYMTDGVRFETRMGDGSASGMLGKLWGAGKRLLTGESLFMTHFSNQGNGRHRVGFAAPYPGTVVPIDLGQVGGRLICQKDSFLAGARGVQVGVHFQRKVMTGLFGGEGFVMQKLEGDGWVFVHAGGCGVRTLETGDVPTADTAFRICSMTKPTPSP
mgnify:CR=1 FL=1